MSIRAISEVFLSQDITPFSCNSGLTGHPELCLLTWATLTQQTTPLTLEVPPSMSLYSFETPCWILLRPSTALFSGFLCSEWLRGRHWIWEVPLSKTLTFLIWKHKSYCQSRKARLSTSSRNQKCEQGRLWGNFSTLLPSAAVPFSWGHFRTPKLLEFEPCARAPSVCREEESAFPAWKASGTVGWEQEQQLYTPNLH